jgi:hypothetical protein
MKTKWRISFRSKTCLYWIHIYKEYFENGEHVYAESVFSFGGPKL